MSRVGLYLTDLYTTDSPPTRRVHQRDESTRSTSDMICPPKDLHTRHPKPDRQLVDLSAKRGFGEIAGGLNKQPPKRPRHQHPARSRTARATIEQESGSTADDERPASVDPRDNHDEDEGEDGDCDSHDIRMAARPDAADDGTSPVQMPTVPRSNLDEVEAGAPRAEVHDPSGVEVDRGRPRKRIILRGPRMPSSPRVSPRLAARRSAEVAALDHDTEEVLSKRGARGHSGAARGLLGGDRGVCVRCAQ
ncbi:hypothetical protein LTR53_004458 [Teratosphaeriaceae sp. CCFEE 6253]|nr:hypothetical protein LTR53_004458 [Teratosphaeriaceae sp. CCFEE 6253]